MSYIWIIYSSITFVTTVTVGLLIRKLYLNGVPTKLQLGMQFILPFFGFLIWILFQPQLLKINFSHLLLIIIYAVVFTQLGTIMAVKSITLAKNPGYALAITRTNVLIVTILSIFLFSSRLSWISFIAIMMIFVFSFFLLDYSNKNNDKKKFIWFWYALGSSFLTSGYALGSKYFISVDIPLLTRMFYAFLVMGSISAVDLFVSERENLFISKIKINKVNLIFLIGIGISTFLFNIFAQLAFEYAPNPGFVNAYTSVSIIPVTYLSAYLFKDELKKWKIIGVFGVLAGLILLFLYN